MTPRLTLSHLACRPDRTSFAAALFVESELGSRYVEPPMLDLTEALADSSPGAPLIFVLSPGIDPTEPLLKLAASVHMSENCFSVALGQGQVAARLHDCLRLAPVLDGPCSGCNFFQACTGCSTSISCLGMTLSAAAV